MITYTLKIEQDIGGPSEVNTYSTAANAIDDLEGLRAGGAKICAILRDELPIDEETLRADEKVGEVIDVE